MKSRLLAGVLGVVLCGTGMAQMDLPCPGEEARYFYRAELYQVVDGRTVALDLDLGFHVWLHKTPIRLMGIAVPDKGTEEGRRAVEWLTVTLKDASELGELRVKTFPAPPGSDVPWTGVIFASGKNVNQELVAKGLAAKAESP